MSPPQILHFKIAILFSFVEKIHIALLFSFIGLSFIISQSSFRIHKFKKSRDHLTADIASAPRLRIAGYAR